MPPNENGLPLKVGDDVYVLSPVCDKWMQTVVSKLVYRLGTVTDHNTRKQLSLMWKRLLGHDKLYAMATTVKELLEAGRSHSDAISDLLCLLPSLREVQLYPTTTNFQLETE